VVSLHCKNCHKSLRAGFARRDRGASRRSWRKKYCNSRFHKRFKHHLLKFMLLIFENALIFFILCGIVNISLNFFGAWKKICHLEKFDTPFDFGILIWDAPVLGASTTWGGLLVSILVGAIIQFFYSPEGIIIGICVFFGHAFGSFIKRRLGVPRGGYVPIVDHGDYVIFTGAVFLCLGKLSPSTYILSIVLALIIHPLFCLAGYQLGIRENRF